MPFSSGTFSLVAGNPVVTGTTISSTWANNTLNDIANNGLSNCLLKNGTQTVTANIPMATYKLTGLGAGTSNGDSLRYEQGMQSVLTTTGDMILASAANTAARLPAAATVAAHATTMDPWVARVVTLSGGAVTFTDIADADFVGQEVLLVMNAAHIWTDGAVFDVQGGRNYTAAVNDQILLTAVTVSTFQLTIFKARGGAPSTTVLTSGSGTYTTPAGCVAIEVELVGGGSGGGAGNSGTASTAGGDTTFGTLTAGGGNTSTTAPGNGGSATNGDFNIVGSRGNIGTNAILSVAPGQGGGGGVSFFGGSANGGSGADGAAAQNNSGSGGGGGGVSGSATSALGGAGGASGGYVRKLFVAPAASYSYGVGASGAGSSTPGTDGSNGGAGGSGIIIVREYY